MKKVMLNGEYLSMETANELVLLRNENKRLREEYKHLSEIYDDSCKSFEKLFKRVNKAIEFIDNNNLYEEIIDYDYEENPYTSSVSDEKQKEELKQILKGCKNGERK